MILNHKVLAIIPARGGTKRLPGKNIACIAGKPLIAWTIEAANACPMIERVVVTTDDPKIAGTATKYGAEVPFLRPAILAKDDTPDAPVCRHTLDWLAQNEDYHPDILIWLRPTCPLRRIVDIEGALSKLINSDHPCVRSVSVVQHHPFWMKRIERGRLIRFLEGYDENTYYQKQKLPLLYQLNGAVDVLWTKHVTESANLFGDEPGAYTMPLEYSVDIDTELDFLLAETILKRQTDDESR